MNQIVESKIHDGVLVIKLNNPPVNALSKQLRQGLLEVIELAICKDEIRAIVLCGRGRCFCGGADIKEFGKSPPSPSLSEVISAIEASPKPVVAALHGVAFGGGLELPLSCHYRIGTPSVQVGLPEVKIGLIPGAGGTQRLPRLIGAEQALNIIINGRAVMAEEALSLGILDALLDEECLIEGSVNFALIRADEGGPFKNLRNYKSRNVEASVFMAMRKRIKNRARGLIAPWHCIESIENAFLIPFDQGIARERELFLECYGSEQSTAQQHIFFAEREARKISNLVQGSSHQKIKSAAIIGCGTMGAGIAVCFARAGIPVKIVDSNAEALKKGFEHITNIFSSLVKRKDLSKIEMDACFSLLETASDIASIKDVDIVIEAVFEEMDLKKEVFIALDKICKVGCILATNTSTLDVDEIAAVTKRANCVIGTHFFSPANEMRLMENIRGKETSNKTISIVMELGRQLGKAPVLVGNTEGFAGNRIYHQYTRQASFLLEEGAMPEQVDKVIYEFGFAMGPFAVNDIAGLDVSWRIRQRRENIRPSDERYSQIADKLCEMGRFGQKTGAGWYRYEGSSRQTIPDQITKDVIYRASDDLGFSRRDIDDQEILERCLFTIINEGAKLLDEGIVLRASDIDVIWSYGYGFPKHQGGPMYYANQIGLETVCNTLGRLAIRHGHDFAPAPLIKKLARIGKDFSNLND